MRGNSRITMFFINPVALAPVQFSSSMRVAITPAAAGRANRRKPSTIMFPPWVRCINLGKAALYLFAIIIAGIAGSLLNYLRHMTQ
jgi:hypothetical protein